MEETAFSQFPVKWRGRVVGSITEKAINQLIQSKGLKYILRLFLDLMKL